MLTTHSKKCSGSEEQKNRFIVRSEKEKCRRKDTNIEQGATCYLFTRDIQSQLVDNY